MPVTVEHSRRTTILRVYHDGRLTLHREDCQHMSGHVFQRLTPLMAARVVYDYPHEAHALCLPELASNRLDLPPRVVVDTAEVSGAMAARVRTSAALMDAMTAAMRVDGGRREARKAERAEDKAREAHGAAYRDLEHAVRVCNPDAPEPAVMAAVSALA